MRSSFLCPFLLCTFLLTFAMRDASVSAQETFAPLITENTVLFIHADFQKADVDTFKKNWMAYSENLMKSLRFEDSALKSTLSALGKDLDKLNTYISPVFETLTQKLGIREIALIVNTADLLDDTSFIIAAPWKGKTDADLQTLFALFPESIADDLKESTLLQGDFLFFLIEELELSRYEQWLADGKLTANPAVQNGAIMQAMKSLGNAEIKIAAAMTETARENILAGLKDSDDMPEPMLNMLIYAARKVEWAAASFPNPLMGEKVPPIKITVKTRTAADARQLRNMLETAIDLGITAWRTAMAAVKAMDADVPEMPQALYAFTRGFLRTYLPAVEGDKLVFQQPDIDAAAVWELYSWGGVSIALLLPAVQAAREAARKQQVFVHVKILTAAVEQYTLDIGYPPTTEQGLAALVNPPGDLPNPAAWKGYAFVQCDPWGNEYQYVCPGRNGGQFDIWSYGRDGKDGTEDDIGSWMRAL